MNLFLDTSVYLGFYKFSDDYLEELQKLRVAIESQTTQLYVTEQVIDEYERNREVVIAESLSKMRSQTAGKSFPRMVMGLPEYDQVRDAHRAYEERRTELVSVVERAAAAGELHADVLISSLFEIGVRIPRTPGILAQAQLRVAMGNPPGKGGSFGDAINWESLLDGTENQQDLHLVTADGDYASALDPERASEFLSKEWAARKGSVLHLYRRLGALFEKHYPDIKRATDLEQELAVDALVNSYSFINTHDSIRRLRRHPDLSDAQVRSLAEAAVSNSQIASIAGDEDVHDFFTSLVAANEHLLDEDLSREFWATFGPWNEEAWGEVDDDAPF